MAYQQHEENAMTIMKINEVVSCHIAPKYELRADERVWERLFLEQDRPVSASVLREREWDSSEGIHLYVEAVPESLENRSLVLISGKEMEVRLVFNVHSVTKCDDGRPGSIVYGIRVR